MIRFSLHLKRKERRKFIKWWGNIQTHLITSSHLHSNSCDYQLLSPFKLTWSPAPISIQTHLITSSYLHSNSPDHLLLSPFKLTWSPAPITIQTHLITSSYLHSNSPDHLLLSPFKLTWSPAPISIQTHLITSSYHYSNSPDHGYLQPASTWWPEKCSSFSRLLHCPWWTVFLQQRTCQDTAVCTSLRSLLTDDIHATPTAWKEKTRHSKLTLAQVTTFTLIRSIFFLVSIVQHKPRGQILQSKCKAL